MHANACIGRRFDGNGRRTEGPVDGVRGKAPYRGCRPGTGRADCADVQPDSSECRTAERPCLGDRITATGRCEPKHPIYVAIFCTPQTHATAVALPR